MPNDEYKDHLYVLILAGGGGTRLWPKSREKTPKQFLQLFGKKTLVELTGERLNKLLPWDRIYVITATEDYGQEIRRLLPNVPRENVIVEPMKRDSAPAHGLGALYIYKKDPQAVIINCASDHLIRPERLYLKTVKAAAKVVSEGDFLATVGIRPTYPHTGMGHMKRGNRIKVVDGKIIYKLEKFVEKPELALAKKYTESGEYFWNANMFVWRADSILKALDVHAPEIGKGLRIIEKALGSAKESTVIKERYELMPKISIDYAVAEKAHNFVMLVGDFNWTDIGDWKEVWANLPKDDMGNVMIDGDEAGGDVIDIDTSDALIHKDGRLIAIIDVDNIVVVDTKDALLICSKSRAQNVKQIVETLKEKKKAEYL